MSSLFATIVFNTLIAGFLTALEFGGGFSVNLVFSQCIGLSILALIQLILCLPLTGVARGAAAAVAVVAGAFAGGMLGRLLTGLGASPDGAHESQSLLIGLVFGGIAAGFFWLRERNAKLESELQARELARVEAEKQNLAAQLRMLQAQVEPHFLFNSLANVAALIETDAKLAARLLDALIRYLRSSLTRTRAEGGTLADEVALLTAYLDVLKIRMGERLSYSFDVDPQLLSVGFPPMLLQPLVENAIRHGLEPSLAGGRLAVTARSTGDRLTISVTDNGAGFAESPGAGMGLANIRARLMAIYGPTAQLELSAKVGAGVTATMTLPFGISA